MRRRAADVTMRRGVRLAQGRAARGGPGDRSESRIPGALRATSAGSGAGRPGGRRARRCRGPLPRNGVPPSAPAAGRRVERLRNCSARDRFGGTSVAGSVSPIEAARPEQRFRDVLECGRVRPQIELLEHHAGLAAHFPQAPTAHAPAPASRIFLVADQAAFDADFPVVVGLEEIDAAKQRALTGSARPDQTDHLGGVDGQVDIAEDRDRIELLQRPRISMTARSVMPPARRERRSPAARRGVRDARRPPPGASKEPRQRRSKRMR